MSVNTFKKVTESALKNFKENVKGVLQAEER